MRHELHGLPMWQECRGNNHTNNRDEIKSNKLPPLCIPAAASTQLSFPRLLSGPRPSRIHRGQPGLESLATKPATGEGGEESESSSKAKGGVHNLSLHLARLRWRRGSGSEQPQLVLPATGRGDGGGGGGRKEGWRWHTMAVCVCGEETAHDSSRGGAQGFSVTPIPHPRYIEVKAGGVTGNRDILVCLYMCVRLCPLLV